MRLGFTSKGWWLLIQRRGDRQYKKEMAVLSVLSYKDYHKRFANRPWITGRGSAAEYVRAELFDKK
jgi:hypothetical protein